MAEVDATKSLSGLLNGIAQKVYYNNSEITEELLRSELYPEMSPDEFTALHDKMKGLLKDSEFVCLEFDETKVNQVLKKMADIQESIDRIVHST